MTDVIIVGAGPAGSALAIHLARQGRQVLLLDRAEFPREKACGEGLMPAGVAALSRLGIAVHGAPFYGVRYRYAGRTAQGEFPRGLHGLGVRRFHLDATLMDAARAEPNVLVKTSTHVQGPLHDENGVVGILADGREYRAPLTIAADGANSVLRHRLGWDASQRSKRHGFRRHYRATSPTPEWVDVRLAPEQETYTTPLPDGEMLVASLGTSHIEPMGLEPLDAPLGAAPLQVRARTRHCQGCVLLGDAAGNCDPITGGGIAQALLSAELLARHLRAWPPTAETLGRFDLEREAMLASYRRLTSAVLALNAHPAFWHPALFALDRSPWLFSKLLGIAGGI